MPFLQEHSTAISYTLPPPPVIARLSSTHKKRKGERAMSTSGAAPRVSRRGNAAPPATLPSDFYTSHLGISRRELERELGGTSLDGRRRSPRPSRLQRTIQEIMREGNRDAEALWGWAEQQEDGEWHEGTGTRWVEGPDDLYVVTERLVESLGAETTVEELAETHTRITLGGVERKVTSIKLRMSLPDKRLLLVVKAKKTDRGFEPRTF